MPIAVVFRSLIVCLICSVLLSVIRPVPVAAQVPTGTARLIRTTLTSQWNPPSPDPSGITYWPAQNRLVISDGEVDEMPIYTGANMFETALSGNLLRTSTTLPYSDEPTGVTLHTGTNRFFFSDDVKHMIFERDPGPDGLLHTADDVQSSFRASSFGSTDAEGVAFAGGSLYIVSGVDAKLYQVRPGANGRFDGVSPAGDDIVVSFDTAAMGETSPEGIEYVTETNALYIVGTGNRRRMLEVSLQGQMQQSIDMTALSLVSPAGLAWGKSSGDPQKNSMYIVDRGIDNNANPAENDGRLFEVALDFIPSATPTPTQGSGSQIIHYTASTEDFPNPERGFMKQSSIFPDQPLDPAKVRALQPSDTLVWIYFRLDNYRDRPIDPAGLSVIRSVFTTARSKGLKLVIRFIYNWGPGWTDDPNLANPDVPLPLALQHIDQLTPLLGENADVIAVVQAGFVGHWGEWHSSKYLYAPESKKAVVDALLSAVPADRMLMLRYPRYKELFYQGPVGPADAFGQTAKSRIGHHNDCFLSDATDEGTYRSKTSQPPSSESLYCAGKDMASCWKGYISQDGLYTPVGGETCRVNPPRSECAGAQQELEQLHWSFLNNDYHPDVLGGWTAGGCMQTIRRRLGYRYELTVASIPQSIQPGGTMNLQFTIRNTGYAALYNQRPVFAVLQGAGARYDLPLPAVDPRRWEAGKDTPVTVNVAVPPSVAPGNYSLGLWLPDQYDTLRTNPAYSVRLANTGIWNAATGIHTVAAAVSVGTPVTGTPAPTVTSGPAATSTPVPPGLCVYPNTRTLACYELWRREFRNEAATKLADYSGDGSISLSDYELWRRTYQ